MPPPVIVWLRDDLRLDDQPAIRAAAERPALFVYVRETSPRFRALGGASNWWLDGSLRAFGEALAGKGARLDLLQGESETAILALAKAAGAAEVLWTRRYGGEEAAADKRLEAELGKAGIAVHSFNGQLLREPWDVVTDAGSPFKVFSAYWRRSRALGAFDAPRPPPPRLQSAPWPDEAPVRVTLESLALLPRHPDWAGGLRQMWRPGEAGAWERAQRFLEAALAHYPDRRDFLSGEPTSTLSPHLRFGEISPRRLIALADAAGASGGSSARAVEKFASEIGWREFSYSLLHNAPNLATRAWQPRFEAFPWRGDETALRAWTRGRTGYPVVDAGLRELWATGYMHNRVRMIAASFLIKHLLIDWRRGEEWFWDTLCDADPANNPASWQWVAGSGADAAPYFRIFNPVLQGQKFDPEGAYVRRWVPELARLDDAHLHAPWLAPREALQRGGVELGQTYPAPIIDHDFARKRALAALASLA